MTRPVIGITGSATKGRTMWLCSAVLVWCCGGKPLRLTARTSPLPEPLHGLIIGGGDDISAHLYGGEIMPDIELDPDRDALEQNLLAQDTQRPTLGICRGAQMMNISRSGTLHSDVYTAYPEAKPMRTTLPRKKVTLTDGSALHRLLGISQTYVNALHHQSVNRKGTHLTVNAVDTYGIIQGIEDPSHPFFIGVQWHPEFMLLHPRQWRLFRALVAAARTYQKSSINTPAT